MKTTLKNTLTLLAAILLFTAACSTTSQNNAPAAAPLTTTTDDLQQKIVNDLSPDERTSFDQANNKLIADVMYAHETMIGMCNLDAAYVAGSEFNESMTETELQASCIELRDECIAAKTDETHTEAGTRIPVPQNCSVTVAEFQTCFQAVAQNYKHIASQHIPCESQTTESFIAASADHPLANFVDPPACKIVLEKCNDDL